MSELSEIPLNDIEKIIDVQIQRESPNKPRKEAKEDIDKDLDKYFAAITKNVIDFVVVIFLAVLFFRTLDLLLPEDKRWIEEDSIEKIDFLFGTIFGGTGGVYISNLVRKHTTDAVLSPEQREQQESF